MQGTVVLDVAIGLFFVYALMALISSSISEIVAKIANWRAKDLEKGIKALLREQYANFKEGADLVGIRFPSESGILSKWQSDVHISPNMFANLVLFTGNTIEKLDNSETYNLEKLLDNSLLPENLKNRIKITISAGKKDIEAIIKEIEDWFNSKMESVTAFYKLKLQKIIAWICIIGAVALNVDSIEIANALYLNKTLRESVVAAAMTDIKSRPSPSPSSSPSPDTCTGQNDTPECRVAGNINKLNELKLPIGWAGEATKWRNLKGNEKSLAVMSKILGLLLTAAAGALGAPFWFDLINRLLPFRTKAGSK